jgi:hypothetical protein
MFAINKLLSAIFVMCAFTNLAQGVTFTGARVGLVETRATGFGSIILVSMYDASTNQPLTSLCGAATGATLPSVMALPLSDPAAKSILQMAMLAKALGSIIAFNTLDGANTVVNGAFCQIGNFQLQG